MKKFYASSIFKSLVLIKKGFKGFKQNKKKGSYKGKIKLSDIEITKKDTIDKALSKIRAFSRPYIGARYKNLVIWKASKINLKSKKNVFLRKKTNYI